MPKLPHTDLAQQSMRVGLALLLLTGCGGGGAKGLLTDARLKALLESAKAEIQGSSLGDNFKASYIGGCITPWLDQDLVNAWIYGSEHPDATGYQAPDMAGQWRSVVPGGCRKVAQEGQVPLDSTCTQDIFYSNQANGQITQSYSIGGTTGMGDVAFIAGYGSGTNLDLHAAAIMQSNHASGSGCSQEIINLLNVGVMGSWMQTGYPNVRAFWSFNAILSTTCTAPKWQCVYMGLYKQ